MKKKQIKPKCLYCYDKGYYSVATGGTVAGGDFIGDKPYKVPLKIVKHPCLKCRPKQADDGKWASKIHAILAGVCLNGKIHDKYTGVVEVATVEAIKIIKKEITNSYQQGRKDERERCAEIVRQGYMSDVTINKILQAK